MFKKIILFSSIMALSFNLYAYEASPGVKVVRVKSVCKVFKNCRLIEMHSDKKK